MADIIKDSVSTQGGSQTRNWSKLTSAIEGFGGDIALCIGSGVLERIVSATLGAFKMKLGLASSIGAAVLLGGHMSQAKCPDYTAYSQVCNT